MRFFNSGRASTAAVGREVNNRLHYKPGKQREYVPCFATMFAPSVEKLIEDALLLLKDGWTVMRTVPGYTSASNYGSGERGNEKNIWEPWVSIGVTARNLTRLREAIGPEAILGIDYHHRLTVAEAASFCQKRHKDALPTLLSYCSLFDGSFNTE